MMRARILVTCSALALTLWGAEPNQLTSEEKRAGFKLLFDGKTLKNWDDPRRNNPPGDAWSIEDGCLKANSKPRVTEDLFSTDTFRDFELIWEWRIAPAGNSGLKYRIQDHLFIIPGKERFESRVEASYRHRITTRPATGQDYVVGFEYQMTDDTRMATLTNAKHTAGALYDIVGPSSKATKPVGDFNASRIVLRGNHVEHWMNGIKVVDAALDSPDALAGIRERWGAAPEVYNLLAKQPKKDCRISLQDHGDEAWFRTIRIRRLPLDSQ